MLLPFFIFKRGELNMKKITLKNFEIEFVVNMLSNQDSLLNSGSPDKKIPISVLWAIDENFRKLIAISQKINEMKQKIQIKYSSDKYSEDMYEDGNLVGRNIKKEYLHDFQKDMDDLMMIDNDIEISTIPYALIKNFATNGKDFQSIKFMIEKDDEINTPEGTIE